MEFKNNNVYKERKRFVKEDKLINKIKLFFSFNFFQIKK